MLLAATYRRALSNKDFFTDGHGRYFRTSGWGMFLTFSEFGALCNLDGVTFQATAGPRQARF